ncbi:MAG: YicC family protein [Clostridia bacterium]|nr:YicC family protein [Clostridia bacterium]
MYSMTGYGKGVASDGRKTITVEMKSVNHRYLDLGLKLPRTFLFLEDDFKKAIESRLSRGHVDVFLTYEQKVADEGDFVVDVDLAKNYLHAINVLAMETGVANDFSVTSLAKLPEVIVRETPVEDEDALKALALSALNDAIESLVAMRQKEGEALKRDFVVKLDAIETSLDKIKDFAPQVVEEYRNNLNARIAEVVEPSLVDRQRLATEVALYADHCAIDEEITRLSTHIKAMRRHLEAEEPVGRKMDFLVQEFLRETNTIGSKANNIAITEQVLAIKNEIEKMREQAQNIE